MLQTLHDEEVLPLKYVVVDCLYGNSLNCLQAVERSIDCIYFVAIPAETRCWLQGPILETRQYWYKGAVYTKRQVMSKDSAPPSVEAIAQGMHE